MTFKVPFNSLSLVSVISGQCVCVWGGSPAVSKGLSTRWGSLQWLATQVLPASLCSSVVLRRNAGVLIVSPDNSGERPEDSRGRGQLKGYQPPLPFPTCRSVLCAPPEPSLCAYSAWCSGRVWGPDANSDSVLQTSGLRCKVSTLSASMS